MKAIFFGTPEFAVPSLEALIDVAEVTAVVCQPDRPANRGLVLTAPPVKQCALAKGITVVQPDKVRTPELAQWVRDQDADIALVVAYGRILPKAILDAPRTGCINVHASLLPRYRGAAPITWAIVRGEKRTGITMMKMDEGMDTGPILEQLAVDITEDETAGELGKRLADLGALGVRTSLPRWVAGGWEPAAQDHANATMAPLLKKEDGRIDWNRPARAIHDHVRGMSPWPMAQTTLAGKRIVLHQTRFVNDDASKATPGTVIFADKSHVLVQAGRGTVELIRIQLEGKKPIRATDWLSGRGVKEGDVLG